MSSADLPSRTDLTRRNSPQAKWGVVGAVIAILILTVLELPPPVGFETRPQQDVSVFWLGFFLIILVSELAALPFIFKRPRLGSWLAIVAAVLNILQVVADQAHMLQPEVAPLAYSVLEWSVVCVSLVLAYFAWQVLKATPKRH